MKGRAENTCNEMECFESGGLTGGRNDRPARQRLNNKYYLYAMNSIDQLKVKLQGSKKIVITTHVSPDGDAIGSSLGLYHYLKKLGREVVVVVPNAFPDFLSWLEGAGEIWRYDKEKEQCDSLIAEAEMLFCLDYNETHRTAKVKDAIDAATGYKVLIDHHIGEPSWPDLNLSVVGASSTCELVFDVVLALENGDPFFFLDIKTAYCLYTGMLTDTGNFQFSATTAKVHDIVSALIHAGVEADVVNNHINNSYTFNRLKFFGYCMSQKMKYIAENKLAYTIITTKEMHEYDIQTGGTEGLVNEPMKVSEVEVSVLFKEDVGKVKISFRSKGDKDVSAFARKFFDGGGHKNAAGGISFLSLKETEQKFLANLAAL